MKVHHTMLLASMIAAAPLVAADRTPERAMANAVGTSSQMRKTYEDDEKKLEQALKPGQDRNAYRRELEKMGYQITSVNYDKPDYVEYEIVKGNNSYEVQSGKASKVDVAPNLWKTDAMKAALRGKKSDYPQGTTANPVRYSDRDRRKAYDSEGEKLEKTLKIGETKDFYRKQLEEMGSKVTSVNADRPDSPSARLSKGTTLTKCRSTATRTAVKRLESMSLPIFGRRKPLTRR